MITNEALRNAGFIEFTTIDSSKGKSMWVNLISIHGVLLIPNGEGAYIPYINATLISDSMASKTPCVQISSEETLNEFMKWINEL